MSRTGRTGSAGPAHGEAAWCALAASGIAFWFVVGFPFGHHNESYDWVAWIGTPDLASVAWRRFFGAGSVRPLAMSLAWATHMWSTGVLEWSLRSSGWFVAALAMMSYTVWHILNGKTTLDDKALQQTWVWRKRVELHELSYAKLIRVRHLEWLIAPRLYTRTFSNKLTVFYAISPAMLLQFQRIEEVLKARSLQD